MCRVVRVPTAARTKPLTINVKLAMILAVLTFIFVTQISHVPVLNLVNQVNTMVHLKSLVNNLRTHKSNT